LGGCLRTVEADAFHPLILRLYLNFSFANFVTACAIGTLQRLCDWRLSIAPARSALRRFLHSMPRGSMCGRSGDAAGEASFPFSACGRVACMCVAIASSRHGCPASAISLVPARSSLDRGMSLFDGERCPCGFRTLKRFVGLPALASVGWPGPGSCAFSREWRTFAGARRWSGSRYAPLVLI